MAIQLNSRDELIFKMIEEHEVLLEKHISYFIADDAKPVLIRDRLRKLFYLDYLICHRHNTKLPWWTTPTKPLVYMLTNTQNEELDRFNSDWQRHHLEVANLRMLYLMAQQEGEISNFKWQTMKGKNNIDALISFDCQGISHKIAIINNMENADQLESLASLKKELELTSIMIVSRDIETQKQIQKMVASSALSDSIFFCVHQEMYQSGIVSNVWQNAKEMSADLFPASGSNNIETDGIWINTQSGTAQASPAV